MKAICYENTKTTLPNWNPNDNLHCKEHFGYAYEKDNYFIHFYGKSYGIQTISPGLTVIEKNNNGISLEQWVTEKFGATNIKKMKYNVGTTIKGIWNPGIVYKQEIYSALCTNEKDNLDERQSLHILIKELSDILLYIEPDKKSLNNYSHKLRNLLILSCTEVENQLASILKLSEIRPKRKNYNMNDYTILMKNSNIKSISITFKNYEILNNIAPFKKWNFKKPTQSLEWYEAYNKTKHNRIDNFSNASLMNVISSIAANIILYCIRFGPYELFNNRDLLSSYINEFIDINFIKTCNTKFYIPLLKIPSNFKEDFYLCDSYEQDFYETWKVKNMR